MAKLKKYIMKDNKDYRPTMNNHRVVMVKRIGSVEWVYGRFTQIDEDMLDLTELEVDEIASLTSDISIPSISLRQAKELLIETDRYQDVLDIIAGIEDPKHKMLITNYWENSQEFDRGHKFLGLITSALGMTEDEVDEFFITASKL
mgnify:CR=1 FL=1